MSVVMNDGHYESYLHGDKKARPLKCQGRYFTQGRISPLRGERACNFCITINSLSLRRSGYCSKLWLNIVIYILLSILVACLLAASRFDTPLTVTVASHLTK